MSYFGPVANAVDVHEVEYRERLQKALGADYELRDLIGRGGFGAVYAAWDRKLERDVAVKALRHDMFPTRLVLERFQREARSVAKLRHPHILPVYSVGEGDGLAFMVMPLIKGESLAAHLKHAPPLSIDEALRITTEVARALEAAHRLGIIHRDVKPENILLEGDERIALLADFGIAKSAGGEGSITGTGIAVGSPHYMSPEQASADKTLDARSDVYSLGAVAYEMLAGRKTFDAGNYQQLLVQQFTTEPSPLRTVAPAVPAPIANVVMQALARDPAARWQSAADFAKSLADASPSRAMTEREEPSWFARRGIVLWVLWVFGGISTAVVLPLIDIANATGSADGLSSAIMLVRRPLVLLITGTFAALILELAISSVLARRRGVSSDAVRRAAFGQPRWWQAWYPRSVRAPDNVWDQMPFAMRAARTIVWLSLASIPALALFVFVVPSMASLAAGAGIPLPLPTRIAIAASAIALQGLAIGLIVAALLVGLSAMRRRVPLLEAIRLTFTWRRANWDTPAGRKLLTA